MLYELITFGVVIFWGLLMTDKCSKLQLQIITLERRIKYVEEKLNIEKEVIENCQEDKNPWKKNIPRTELFGG